MCGIVGYVGLPEKTKSVLYEGLKRLEYRGYDSSGVCYLDGKNSTVIRSEGKLENLNEKLKNVEINSPVGIGHTRWATHGKPSEINAHPHTSGPISVVHNGIVENCFELKDELEKKGYKFYSDTDTEVISQYIFYFINEGKNFVDSVRATFEKIQGSYAVAVLNENEPDKIIATRRFSPLVIAKQGDELYLASDIPAILPYSNEIIFLEDNDFAILRRGSVEILDKKGRNIERKTQKINWDSVMIEKAGYRHYMLKEIHEQPHAVFDTLRGRFSEDFEEVIFSDFDESLASNINRISITACGTSYHASLIGKYMLESLSRLNTQVELASEFKYREPVLDKNSLVVAVSQSGETADTSEALLEAKKSGVKTLGITNVELSKISRESDFLINTKAGPEIGVASTKAFTTQVMVFYLLSVYLGMKRKVLNKERVKQLIKDAVSISKIMQNALDLDSELKELSKDFYSYKNFIYLGRGISYPIALEGALKLKEISYIHAEGYAAGEMKHGPIALIDENMPVVFIAPDDQIYYKKLLGNFQEIKARGGKIIFITSNADSLNILDENDKKILIPKCPNLLSPLITAIPVQFLAYHIANRLGTDIDQPRNLAKVVTVE